MKTLIVLLLTIIISTSTIAAPVGSGFNYQGELSDGNSPANGSYDIQFKAFSVESGGTEYVVIPEFLATVVSNGLFNIDNVDFGDALFDGEEYWIEVSVKLAGSDTYTALSPRQKLNATPYAVQAEFLAANGASSGDVLQFIGGNWVGNALNIEPTPWDVNGFDIAYEEGNVGIGTDASTALHVKDSSSNPVIIDGGNRMYVSFHENGLSRGYIGSYQSQPDTNDEDFEIGTVNFSTGNMHIVTGNNQPRITVTSDGKVGINNLIPSADLHVSGETLLDGKTVLTEDVSQAIMSNGIMKYMVYAYCQDFNPLGGGSNPRLIRSYNGTTNTNDITIVPGGVNNSATCVINFPTDISNRYWQVSSTGVGHIGINTHCEQGSSNALYCYLNDPVTADPLSLLIPAKIMLLVY